jgi:tetratricopeptide (TPR) repeat protein
MARHIIYFIALVVIYSLTAIAEEPNAPLSDKPQWQRMLEGDDARNAAEFSEKIRAAQAADDYVEVVRLCEELLALGSRVQGADHWQVVNQKWALEGARKLAELSPDQRAAWRKSNEGASEALRLETQFQQAKAFPLREEHFRQCERVFGERHPFTVQSCGSLAGNLFRQGRYADARPLQQKALDLRLELLGENHPATSEAYSDLAVTDFNLGNYTAAQPLQQAALDISLRVHGEKHEWTARCYEALALILHRQGKYPEAQTLNQAALDMRLGLYGEQNLATALSFRNVAYSLESRGKHADAQPLYQKSLDVLRQLYGEKHAHATVSYRDLGSSLTFQGKYVEAEPVFRRCLELTLEQLGEARRETAEPVFEKGLGLCRESLGDDHPDTVASGLHAALNLQAQGRPKEALNLLTQAAAGFEASRLRVARRGLDRAVVGEKQSPYNAMAVIQAGLQASIAAWEAAESNLARGLQDEYASRRGSSLSANDENQRDALNEQLARTEPRILQLVSKQTLTDDEQHELSTLQYQRHNLERDLADLAVALARREIASLPSLTLVTGRPLSSSATRIELPEIQGGWPTHAFAPFHCRRKSDH